MSTQTICYREDAFGRKCAVEIPDTCPRCGYAAHFEEKASCDWIDANYNSSFAFLLLCPHCLHIICLEIDDCSEQYRIFPQRTKFHIDQEIRTRYPRFAKIYEQALAAESFGLDEIAGMGMRKAVEALIKQLATELHPDRAEQIKNEMLSQTIKEIEFQDVQLLAKANAYIGNDFTHLVQKHPEYTLKDLKKLIEALQYYILMTNTLLSAKEIVSTSPHNNGVNSK